MPRRPFTHLFYMDGKPKGTLQNHIRQMLVDCILSGQYPVDIPLPPTRNLAKQLGVSRNTVMAVYVALVDEEIILSKVRSGYYVNPKILLSRPDENVIHYSDAGVRAEQYFWKQRIHVRPSTQRNISKPTDWQSFHYPFICGQIDYNNFPVSKWRECSRNSLSLDSVKKWVTDSVAKDDEDLIEQIRTRLLPHRGIVASPEEILITVGSQNALYMASRLLINGKTKVALESPGYPDARNLFELRTQKIKHIPVDRFGMAITDELASCDYAYVTPSHQVPTTVTMPLSRRKKLLDFADRNNIVIFEDDYESEVNFQSQPIPALKSMDRNNRVVYFSSLSKTLAPGLRIGFMVGPKELIKEVRALRRLIIRHVPTNTQETLSIFLKQGGYDSLVYNMKRVYEKKWHTLLTAIERHLPTCVPISAHGGSSVWVQGPEGLDSQELADIAKEAGVLIEPGSVYFPEEYTSCPWFRMGFSAIPESNIEGGVKILGGLIKQLTRHPTTQSNNFEFARAANN